MDEEGKRGPRRRPIQLTVPDDARAVLERVGNASDYVSRMVVERRREWSEALHLLEREGWAGSDVSAACAALGGSHHPFDLALPEWVSGEMRKVKQGTGKARLQWLKRCEQATREPVARAVAVLARERWAGNREVAAALED